MRCWELPVPRAAFACVVSSWATSGGSGAPALGGRELSRNARTTRPSANVVRSSSCHSRWLASTRSLSPSRILSASSRASAPRAKSSAATSTDRRSRRSTRSMPARAASARSCHSAICTGPTSDSASRSTPSAGTSGAPCAAALRFCSSMPVRTAARPPRATCSATTCCSAGSEAMSSSRCLRLGRSLRALGRGGRSGVSGFALAAASGDCRLAPPSRRRRPSPSPRLRRWGSPVFESADRSRLRRSPSRLRLGPRESRSLSPPRSPSPPRLRLPRPLFTRAVVVPAPRSGGPIISMRSAGGLPLRALGGSTPVTKMPSTSNSASTRRTSPSPTSGGSRSPSSTPLGCFAPAARHVHEPSSRRLVSSTSRRRLTRSSPTLAAG